MAKLAQIKESKKSTSRRPSTSGSDAIAPTVVISAGNGSSSRGPRTVAAFLSFNGVSILVVSARKRGASLVSPRSSPHKKPFGDEKSQLKRAGVSIERTIRDDGKSILKIKRNASINEIKSKCLVLSH